MSNKDNGILQEHIREQLDNRKKPLKREKQEFSMIAMLGGILFLITLLVTLLMQLGQFF
ncbi:XRE family transcriptional regulator [Streptococcus cristatus]|uniref:XRE family transcriptional regulator n=1 Tax=Streptococcus cristatus TaxID=45634 RepID=UPI001EF367BA|nr:XRE family transcriptional regulator [Streptococcus cristatus]MCG7330032.1 XRE family transcriptional regulator [Streptococcus cristatus]